MTNVARNLVDVLVSERHPAIHQRRRCPDGAAVTWAAVIAFRSGLTEPIPDDFLRRLFDCYALEPTDERFQAALDWATTPVCDDEPLLRRSGLAHMPSTYLVEHAPRRWDERSECAWQKLLRSTTTEDAVALGIAASEDGRTDHAIEAFAYADDHGSQDGALLLGLLFEDRGNLIEPSRCGAGLISAVMPRAHLG